MGVASVSRVLSGHPDVSEDMRERVMRAVEELGYEHNLLWQSLRAGATHTIGIVVRDVSSHLWSQVALSAESVLQDAGYSMLLSNSRGQPELDIAQIRVLDRRRVDGVIVSPADVGDPDLLRVLERLRIPIVAIDRDLPSSLGASAALIDHRCGMRAAVEHLASLGHTTIGYVSPPEALRPTAETSASLREVCDEYGLSAYIVPGPFSEQHGYDAARRLLEDEGVTAIFAGSSQIFPGVLQAVRSLGVRVPRDLSLIAIETLPLLSLLQPSMSVVTRKSKEIGETAAQLIVAMLEGAPPEVKEIPTEYAPGDSCGVAPRARRRTVTRA